MREDAKRTKIGRLCGFTAVYATNDELMDLRYCFIRAVMENAEYVAAESSFTVRVNSDGSTYVWAGRKESHPETKQMFKIDDGKIISFPPGQETRHIPSSLLPFQHLA